MARIFFKCIRRTGESLATKSLQINEFLLQKWRRGKQRAKTTDSGSSQLLKTLPHMWKELAPKVGLEPTTTRLTAACSTIELLWNPKSDGIYKSTSGASIGFTNHRPQPPCRRNL